MIAPFGRAGSKRAPACTRGFGGRSAVALWAFWLALAAGCAQAGQRASSPVDGSSLRLLRSETVADPAVADAGTPAPTHRLALELAVIAGSGWSAQVVVAAAQQAGRILAQCGIGVGPIRLSEFDGPERYRYLATRTSRDLARRVNLGRPALFFVADTLHRPAFDAEAIGRANSRTRPEMADTVWITAGTRDLPVVIAHELVHVLADSGEHSNDAGNLMGEDTTPGNTRLTAGQCRAMVTKAEDNGLLRRVR